MNNVNIIKAIQCLIGSNCLVSTPETFYVGPKGYDSKVSLEKDIQKNSEDIANINTALQNKIDKDNVKTINGNSIIGTGNISITTESGVVDLSPYLTIEEASLQYSSKENVSEVASTAVRTANTYTDNKIANLDPQHVNITDDYKEFSKQFNVGRLVYLTKDSPVSFMFISNTGMPFYTKIYNPSSSEETITNVDAYSDAFLTKKIETQTEGFGDLVFANYIPDTLTPFTGNPLSYYKTFVLTSGLYYLSNVNDPILIASEESILKLNEAITETEAREILISKNRLKYITGTISLNTLESQGIYELYLDNMYQGTYYNNIAYLIKVGTKVFVQGLVRVDDYGVVYINPSSYTSNWYQNTYSNRWVKFIDPDISSINDSLQEHINITDNKFLGIQNALNNYYVIDSVEEWENTIPKIGDMVEMQVLTIPTHKYHVWKSNDGEIIYSKDFDLGQIANINPYVYSDRYFGSLLNGGWNYEVDEAGRKHVLADEYKDRAPFYYVKTIDSSINDELGRRVSILTSLGYRKVAELF